MTITIELMTVVAQITPVFLIAMLFESALTKRRIVKMGWRSAILINLGKYGVTVSSLVLLMISLLMINVRENITGALGYMYTAFVVVLLTCVALFIEVNNIATNHTIDDVIREAHDKEEDPDRT